MCISLGYTIPIEVKILKILKKTLPLLEDRKRVKNENLESMLQVWHYDPCMLRWANTIVTTSPISAKDAHQANLYVDK